MSERDPIAEALAGWRAATAELQPPPALVEQVCAAVARQPAPVYAALVRGGRRAILAGALGAALLSVVALRSVRVAQERAAEVALMGWTP